ncbi:MAG: hypothetical protein QS2022_7880 [Candidatus Phytoplasma asteris]|nr:MAG: hypothetical protein PLY_7830 [Periwinkle leaf yellowing phytoplasma]WEX19998.1 MAG: hypothetical protein QS2022_7880 [Candidatus Phytoplasma asteris]
MALTDLDIIKRIITYAKYFNPRAQKTNYYKFRIYFRADNLEQGFQRVLQDANKNQLLPTKTNPAFNLSLLIKVSFALVAFTIVMFVLIYYFKKYLKNKRLRGFL